MQRYFSSKKDNDYFELNKDDIRHIKLVMRMKDNDLIEVVYDNKVYLCCLENVNSNIRIKIKNEVFNDIKKDKKVCLIIPVLKENKMDMILQKSTELGVDEIIPVITERSIIRVDGKENKKIERWNRICKEASEQSMRTDIPKISNIKNLKDIINIDGLKVICSTTEKKNNIKMFLQSNNSYDKINLVVGPEGGLSNNEEKFLENNNFVRVSLGSQILRVETVPIFILSVINYENME